MFQNQAALKGMKYSNFKTSHEISYTWKSNLVYDLLAKKRNLQIGQLMKFWWSFEHEYFSGTYGMSSLLISTGEKSQKLFGLLAIN